MSRPNAKITRRNLIGGIFAGAASSTCLMPYSSLILGVTSALAPKPATAEPVTASLAIASAVSGIIAAHNRSDGGMGSLLKATIEYQRILTSQLASIQVSLAAVLESLSALPAEMREMLRAERLSALHTDIGSALIAYRNEVTLYAGKFRTYQDWQNDRDVQFRLRAIDQKLNDAVDKLEFQGWFDPLTAIYLPAALYTTLGIHASLQDDTGLLMARAQRYLNLFRLIEDPNVISSTAAELARRQESCKQIINGLSWYGLEISEEDTMRPINAVLDYVTVQDFTPKYSYHDDNQNRDFIVPDRFGDKETFLFETSVESFYLDSRQDQKSNLGIRQWRVASKELEITIAATVPTPSLFRFGDSTKLNGVAIESDSGPAVISIEAKTHEDRIQVARNSRRRDSAIERLQMLEVGLSKLNVELAYLSNCIAALTAVSCTRTGIFRFFGKDI